MTTSFDTLSKQGLHVYNSITHQYGPYTLKYDPSMSLFECEVRNDSILYHIEEKILGTLIHERSPGNYEKYSSVTQNTILIEYYDTTTHKLKKRIDLEKITPYNERTYRNITISSLDYEGMDIYGPDSNCIWPKLAKPTHYHTHNSILSISPNGYICIGFELIKMAKINNTVVGWEQILMVLDAEGRDVIRIPLDHVVRYSFITDDGKFLCLFHRRSGLYEPFDPCQDALSIYDLPQKKRVYYREFKKDQSIGLIDPEQTGGGIIMHVASVEHIKPERLFEIINIQPNQRELRTYYFSPDEGDRYLKMKPFQVQID